MNKKIFVPTLYPISRDMEKVWFVKWHDTNGRVQKTYGNLNKLPTKKDREKEAIVIIERLQNPNFEPRQRGLNIVQLLSKLNEFKKAAVEPKTYLCYDCIINDFALWYRNVKGRDIRENDYFNHLASKGLHKNTIRNRHIVLKGLCRELIERGNLFYNPFDNIKFKKIKPTSKLPFSKPQSELLKSWMKENDPQLLLACEMMYYLFLRPNELRQLKICDILFDEWKVCLSGTIAKDNDVIYKTVPEPFREKLLQLKNEPFNNYIFSLNNKPGPKLLVYKTLTVRHRKMLDELNISKRYSFYSWVHTGIKNAALSNIPIKQLQLQKGHHDLNMFDQYLKDLGVDDCSRLVNEFPVM